LVSETVHKQCDVNANLHHQRLVGIGGSDGGLGAAALGGDPTVVQITDVPEVI
jgi:hypothetical protein